MDTNMNHKQHYTSHQTPMLSLRQAHKLEKDYHRELVRKAMIRVEEFIGILANVPSKENSHMLTMDLVVLFEQFCGFDLPERFAIVFGKKINKACLDGLLPFKRGLFGRASLAGFKGIDARLLLNALKAAVGDVA